MIEDILGLCGTVVAEKYQVNEAVGKGGFAIVYRATHLLWKRPVALKVFKEFDEGSAQDRQSLIDDLVKEASLLAQLSEKTASICQARDLGMLTTPSGAELPYMVLEWLEGKTLDAMLLAEQAASLPPRSLAAAVALLDPIAEGLAVAHTQGIAHRDVKPGNVFVSVDAYGQTSSVKLLDFGIAKVVQDAQKTGGAFQKTAGHVTAFTPNYGAPEQFSRKFGATGPWTDVFAFALVLIECAAGRRLSHGGDIVEMAKTATDGTRRPTPRAFGVAASDATEAVFTRALAVHPSQRYPTVGDFWVALVATLGIEPSRAVQGAVALQQRDLFSAVASANTAPAPPSAESRPLPVPAARAASTRPAPTSGKKVLAGLAGMGVVLIGTAVTALEYDRAHAAPPPPAPSASAGASLPVQASVSASAVAVAARHGCPDGMVLIDKGEFFMGSDEDDEAARPAHHVALSPYCIDVYEVTTSRYQACSASGKCKRGAVTNDYAGITARDHDIFDRLCSARDPDGQAEHPMVCVDWAMASTFCGAIPGGRLPTEAEWEFAARGPDGRRYPWGDQAPSAAYLNACGSECVAWGREVKLTLSAMYTGDDSWPNTAQVGSFPKGKSPFGLYDVAGNVWEWVADWQAPYSKEAERDPKGPAEGTVKVIRGGAWNGGLASWVRPTFRFSSGPQSRSYGIGFRCAATPR